MPCFVLFRYRSVLFSSLCFQERWHQLQTPSSGKTVQHSLVLLGGPGTGKTHMLKLAISLQHCFFPKTTQQCAFMNSAARLINGRTLHSALHLPNGSWTPSSRGLGKEKDKILAAWRRILLLCIDEISMVPADLFAGTEFRARQVKQQDTPWGNMTVLLTGDYLQLPPVAAVSLADPVDDPHSETDCISSSNAIRLLDASQGRRLWQQIGTCVLLEHSHRASGTLQEFLQAMRSGTIAPRLWTALLQRTVSRYDIRMQELKFWSPTSCVGVLRHNTRAVACLWRAKMLASLSKARLLVCPAVDTYRSEMQVPGNHPDILRYLCNVTNLTDTKNLPGVLFLWQGCTLCLEDKISEAHGLVRGCRGVVDEILLHSDEPPFDSNPAMPPHVLRHLPVAVLLRVEGPQFQQSPLLQPNVCAILPVTRDWTHKANPDSHPYLDPHARALLQEGPLHITRRQLPCTNPLACTAYNLQGQQVSAMLADLRRPPRMKRAPALVAIPCLYSR